MWKRLNNSKGSRQSAAFIGDPVLQETTLDARDYPGLNIDTAAATKRDPLPPRRPDRGDAQGLSIIPSDSVPRSQVQHQQYRPVSSIYSEAMPTPLKQNFSRDSYATVTTSYTEPGVSPPSSPEFTSRVPPNANADDDDVSPIDESPDLSRLNIRSAGRPGASEKPSASSIPILRREKRRNQVAAAAVNLAQTRQNTDQTKGRQAHDPRWDPYSGEITTSDRGKPQSVKPGEYTPPELRVVQRPDGPILRNQPDPAGSQAHTSFSDRVRKLKPSNGQVEKPGWKGASGRATLVNPVSDQPDVKPLNIPRKINKRITSPELASSVSAARKADTNPLTSNPPTGNASYSARAVQPSGSRNSPRSDSPISVIHDPVDVPASAAVQTQGRGHPNPRPVPGNQYEQEVSAGTREQNFRDTLAESYRQATNSYVEPPSRFSITTYAPSEAQTTPRPSNDTWDRPEMPPLPTAAQPTAPIVNRKRPPVLGDSPDRLTRKAIPPSSPVFISMRSSRRDSTLSQLSKNLPQTPGEASSRDLITSLQAQIDNLQHRRTNIVRSIRQMTELMPQDRITVTDDVRLKREDEKRKVEGLREEEADIRREEHELGLRLHRAFKRKDKEAVYEPTGLWVRRVTG